jgi:hypothetical protein
MLNRFILIIIMFSGSSLYAQDSGCKVLLPRLSGTYQGDCKNGFANGKGVATGTDRYEGEFKKGLPDGMGIYRWADGTFYDGYWKQGMRNGTGRMIYSSDSIVTGYWKADKYTGEKEVKKYEVLRSLYIARTSFIRVSDSPNQIKIRLTLGGSPNTSVTDFSMMYTSGEEFKLGYAYGLQNVTFPVTVRITYVTWNLMHSLQTQSTLEFKINESGNWEVNIQN